MPRRRKTASGADAQDIPSTAGVRYGEGDDMQAMQRDMPSPNGAAPITPGPAAAPVNPPTAPDQGQVGEFLASHRPALLSGTQQPDVPLTDGLSTGPGRGPDAVRANSTPIARTLQQLSRDTGNSKWARLAQRAGL